MFSAWPLSGRSPVSGSTSAYLTDELPELSTRTRPAEPGEAAMAGMLPAAGYVRSTRCEVMLPGRLPAGTVNLLRGFSRTRDNDQLTGLGSTCHFLASIRTSTTRPCRPRPARGWRWTIPVPSRLPVPAAGALIYAGIRLISVVLAAFMLGHGKYRLPGWSLIRWMRSSDGGHYRAIAAHGYAYPPGQLAHASVFSWFPGYPAAIDSLAWLPWITIVAAGLIVTAVAGLAAAWGLTTLGLKLTGDPRISLLLAAVWAVAPSSVVLTMVYAEALFCALAGWALVALVSRRWLTAGLLTLAAGTVRSTAVALIAAVGVAAAIAVITAVRARQPFAAWWRPAAAALLAPLGLLGYLGYVADRDAPAGRLVLGRAAHLPHGVRLGREHAAGDQGRRARPAFGGRGPGDRGHRRGGRCSCSGA